MKVGGQSLRDHFLLLLPFFVVIAAVAILRAILYEMLGLHWLVRSVSVAAAVAVSVLLATFLIHRKKFGGYANVIVGTFLLVVWGQVLVVLMIVLSLLTGTENVFTHPRFSPPGHIGQVGHIIGHLTVGIGAGNLIGAAMASLFLFLLRIFDADKNHGSV